MTFSKLVEVLVAASGAQEEREYFPHLRRSERQTDNVESSMEGRGKQVAPTMLAFAGMAATPGEQQDPEQHGMPSRPWILLVAGAGIEPATYGL